MKEINERITALVNQKTGGNKSKFAAAIGANDTSVRLWMDGRSPDVCKVAEICRAFNVSPAWILLGDGDMDYSSPSDLDINALKKENEELKSALAELNSKIQILYNALDAVTRK